MSLKSPIYHEFDLAALKGDSKPIRITHIDDTNVDVLELCVRQGGEKIDLTGATVTARIVLHAKRDYLINDNVQCTVNDSGNVLIPFDNAVIESHKGVLKIEVNIRRAEDVLTLQFPLWVIVNDTILAAAEVLPESEGTIPELLKEAAEELERVQGFVTSNDVYNILDHTLQGAQNVAPSLYVEPKGNNYALVYEDSEDVKHELFDFSNLPSGGTSDYTELENKPSINNVTLQGNKSSDDLGLQKKLTIQESSGDDPKDYLFLRNNGALGFNSQFVLSIQDSGFPKLSYWSSVNGVASITTSSIVSDELTVGINGNIPVSEDGTYYRFCTNGETRKEIYLTNSGKAYQKLTTLPGGTWVEGQWQEIGGDSQIVSGVVNQNGTITFTDSDGNTFTTSGSSVIGADGFSPTATVTQTQSGATVSITDKNGTTTANISNGADGQDYVLTAQDKSDIANIVLSELPTTQGVLYGD